jgi:hypothetical protein
VDRARRKRSRGLGRWGGDLKTLTPLLVLCAACTVITGDLGRIIAIEIDGAAARNVEENETVTLSARAIDAAGDTVPDAIIVWELLVADSGTAVTGFELDGTTGIIQATTPGHGRVRARVDDLLSDTISIVVTGAPDSIAASGDTLLTMASGDIVSPAVAVALFDLTTDPIVESPLAEKMVTFRLVYPVPGAPEAQGFFLTEGDSVPGMDHHTLTVPTDGTGNASVFVRRIADSTLPDSAVVDAAAVTATGITVTGSPVRFTVVFESGS